MNLLPHDTCPVCKKTLNAVTSIGEMYSPKPGDVSLCTGCGVILEFDDQLKYMLVSDTAIQDLDPETLEQLMAFSDAIVRRNYSRALN